ncbi:hypothetical protein V3C99_010341 [Haemonchus contortus]|uniref:DUF4005 domain-containing protein n=1 Tax=Haemonchus contortus TaxID=6289 RepID=A0A7I5EA25_HAECO
MDEDPDKSIDGFPSKPTKHYKTDNESRSRSSTLRSQNEKSQSGTSPQKYKGVEHLDMTISQSAPIMTIPPVSLPFTVEQETEVSPRPFRITSSNHSNIALNETQLLNRFKNSTAVDNSTAVLFRVVTVLFTIKMIIRTVQFVFKVGLSSAYWLLQLWKHVKVRRAGGKKNGTTEIQCFGVGICFLRLIMSLLTPSTEKRRTSRSFTGPEESAFTAQKKEILRTSNSHNSV